MNIDDESKTPMADEGSMLHHVGEKPLSCPFCGSAGKWFKTGSAIGIECASLEDCPGRAQTDVYPKGREDAAIRAWNSREQADLTDAHIAVITLETELSATKAELEKATKDAARYRWLRDKSEPHKCALYMSVGEAFKDVKFTRLTVDTAIDDAIAGEFPEGTNALAPS